MHAKLLRYMKKLGYKIDEEGMCYGFAHMGLQAILANDIETYNRRLQVIEEIPLKKIEQEIKRVRGKVKENKLLPQEEIDRLLSKAHTEKERLRLLAEQRDRDILSIPAFFDGVAVYFQPEEYPFLFEEGMRPSFQNVELTSARVLPKPLTIYGPIEEKDKQKRSEEKKDELKQSEEENSLEQKIETIEKSNITKIADFSGIYNQRELASYFNILFKTLKNQKYQHPIGFVLCSLNHAVTVGYDPKKQQWQWIDSGKAENKTASEIANLVINSFSSRPGFITNLFKKIFSVNTTFSTKIYVKNSELELANKYINACKNDWEKIHNITQEKARREDSEGTTWLHIAARDGHLDTVNALLAAGADQHKALKNGATPLYIAEKNGHLDIVNALNKTLKDIVNALLAAGADKDKALKDGATPLYIAAQEGHLDKVNALLAAGADKDKALKDGRTPLFVAAQKGHLDIVNALLAAGADQHKAYHHRITPSLIAEYNGHRDIVNAFMASRNARNALWDAAIDDYIHKFLDNKNLKTSLSFFSKTPTTPAETQQDKTTAPGPQKK